MNTADIIVFADLDDTLFSTERKIQPAQFTSSVAVTQASNGRHSYMTPHHQQMLDWIDPQRLIPVTARGTDAFANVQGWICKGPYSIIANGATVLDSHGHPVSAWCDVIDAALSAHRARLQQLPELIGDAALSMQLDIRVWNVEEPSCGPVYTVVKSNLPDDGACLQSMERWLFQRLGSDTPWVIQRNGNNLALLPPGLSKAAATRFVMSRLSAQGQCLHVGFGDSVSDLEFMQACDFWITPSASQISRLTARLME